jgi:hypothetical protein
LATFTQRLDGFAIDLMGAASLGFELMVIVRTVYSGANEIIDPQLLTDTKTEQIGLFWLFLLTLIWFGAT